MSKAQVALKAVGAGLAGAVGGAGYVEATGKAANNPVYVIPQNCPNVSCGGDTEDWREAVLSYLPNSKTVIKYSGLAVLLGVAGYFAWDNFQAKSRLHAAKQGIHENQKLKTEVEDLRSQVRQLIEANEVLCKQLVEQKERSESTLEDMTLCVVCEATEKVVMFDPCGHVCCCHACGDRLATCPMCQEQIQTQKRVYYTV
mmetsp:Transcript_6811/g.10542  ORF Transcript_6811/g.10542 Transcript_6811/m.10542 type:complete len:200 (+) Transcript_6811:55-654(+)|eukprot:CAMPEP_0175100392 /NCGR_PEP_ID=MMETSP0086_2-20121207/7080_1 /TAXON_ID=136419 /ORGANISM="Unknown Unknown, Strain D1" /LENGTH=199 /DNA_ID=CAMNT_0016374535 /DNA_START=55 /DNA_END=654 /DNA_ORIENTATION=-